MFEDVYYADDTIKVTDDWVKLHDLAYPVPDIKSASVSKVTNDPVLPWTRAFITSGVLTFMVAIVAYFAALAQGKDLVYVIAGVGVVATLCLMTGLMMREFHKPEYLYVVNMKGAFGKTSPITSKDETYVRKVVEAIHKAIRNYR